MAVEYKPENGNGHRSPWIVNVFFSKKTGYSADIFSGTVFQERKDELARIAIDLIVQSNLWSLKTARAMVMNGMGEDNTQNASMILFRKTEAPQGKYIGVSWQEVNVVPDLPSPTGKETVLYLRLRAFKEWHRRIHLGASSLQLALLAHSQSEPAWLVHRTQSPAAAYSVIRSGIFREDELYPWSGLYDANPVAQQIMTWHHFKFRNLGKKVDMSTGVSIGDYLEQNRAYAPDLSHSPTMEIRRKMEEFGMVFEQEDPEVEDPRMRASLLVTGHLK